MFTITVLCICFLAAISFKIKKVKAPLITGLIWYFHLAMCVFSILCVLLLISGYGFKGTYTERVFFTLYGGSGILLYGLTPKEVSGKWVYLCSFYGFPFVLLFGLLLPPLRILTMITGMGLLSDGDLKRYQIDDDYAIQTKSIDIVSRYPSYSLIEDKYWLFEKISGDVIKPEGQPAAFKSERAGADSVRLFISLVDEVDNRKKLDTTISLRN
ncbi:hypothetical protein [Chitinophaga pinensis]|uniref:Uncharacterized protein n=1 Tax=Chitinophaga pinensis (strain ATCC 43595 / DSM 2588 / LMG 13176 / NBRC 15968 / NCIMB 11800 / UQM 2034) TaxID=485918 RepID=A0A979GZD0_CHIPD|nr:hypothetical protein [Chitinophaga pinensis]ACU63846.1 hypothetical protein Cpin_6442 [Chitinophaga pinensis DSM 2588]